MNKIPELEKPEGGFFPCNALLGVRSMSQQLLKIGVELPCRIAQWIVRLAIETRRQHLLVVKALAVVVILTPCVVKAALIEPGYERAELCDGCGLSFDVTTGNVSFFGTPAGGGEGEGSGESGAESNAGSSKPVFVVVSPRQISADAKKNQRSKEPNDDFLVHLILFWMIVSALSPIWMPWFLTPTAKSHKPPNAEVERTPEGRSASNALLGAGDQK